MKNQVFCFTIFYITYMNMSNNYENIERYSSSSKDGLSSEQVSTRKKQGLDNKTKIAVGKSYWEIIATNVLSFFNIILFVIAALMIYAGRYNGLLFLFVLIPNIIVGLYEDIKARVLLKKLRLVTQPRSIVVRNSEQIEIANKDIVLDDVLYLTTGTQISADAEIIEGTLLVNESLLTGESDDIAKVVGDKILSGSYVVSGNAYARVMEVGKNSYVQTIQSKANKFKRSPSQILSSLRRLFKVIGLIVIVMAVATIIVYATQGRLSSEQAFKDCISPLSASMVALIPSGLYLLTSVALATAVISLANKKAQVQDFYSVEMLARTNVLCVDKTGTITDGTMTVKKVVLLDTKIEISEVEQAVADVLHATKDNNFTAIGLKNYFTFESTKEATEVLPFNSDNKYSAASFKGGKTYAIGAIEYLDIDNKQGIIKRSEEYTVLGNRVLVIAEASSKAIKGGKVTGKLKPLALIVLQDHIRPDAIKTFAWFEENNVEVKVISGDNALTVSEIARQAGIKNASHFISLEGMTDEEVANAAPFYTVFGRVTPEQKEIIITTLKNEGKTVAMTGDGVNDILALKRADCSIAMASGSDAARNVSHIVLMDSNFDRLPSVVAEGRRVINNLQRTASVFLVKTTFAMFFSIYFLLAPLIAKDQSIIYPFSTNNLYLWELFGIGYSAFFLALEKNSDLIKGNFLKNIFTKAIPAGVMVVLAVLTIYIMFYLQKSGAMFTGVMPDIAADGETLLNTSETARAMASLVITALSLVVLFKVCSKFSTYRKIVYAGVVVIVLGLLVWAGIVTYQQGWSQIGTVPMKELSELNIFQINFLSLSFTNYIEVAVIVIVFGSTYLFVTNIVSKIMEVKANAKN